MGVIKHEYNYTELPIVGNEIIDKETGEIFDISNAVLLKKTEIGKFSISYSSFIFLNTEELKLLLVAGIKDVDLALLISMSSNLVTGKNICLSDDDTPHTAASIGKLISNSEQATKLKLNSLVKEGLLHYGVIKQEKGFGKVYVVNPHLIKKGVDFSVFLKELFDESTTTTIEVNSNKINYTYNKYFHLDTTRLRHLLRSGIKQIDLALVISMSGNLEDDLNICLRDDDTPHTTASIGKLINNSEQSTKLKLNRLVKKGLLHYGVIKKKQGFGKVYIVNPHLIKRTKFFISFLAELFNDVK